MLSKKTQIYFEIFFQIAEFIAYLLLLITSPFVVIFIFFVFIGGFWREFDTIVQVLIAIIPLFSYFSLKKRHIIYKNNSLISIFLTSFSIFSLLIYSYFFLNFIKVAFAGILK